MGDPATPPTTRQPKRLSRRPIRATRSPSSSQPDDEYYTLLGTAFASKAGPDVLWANGGAKAKALTSAR